MYVYTFKSAKNILVTWSHDEYAHIKYLNTFMQHNINRNVKKCMKQLSKISLFCSFSIFHAYQQPSWKRPPYDNIMEPLKKCPKSDNSHEHSKLVLIIPYKNWSFLTISDHFWPVLIIPDHSWSFLTSPDHSWPALIIPDQFWSFLTSSNH